MTTTIMSPEPPPRENGVNRWFASGQLHDAAPMPEQPLLVDSPSAAPLPKRSVGKHRVGRPAAEYIGATLAAPTPEDLKQVRGMLGELQGLVARATASHDGMVETVADLDDAARAELATSAARRVAKGHLNYDERDALSAVLSTYASLPSTAELPTALLAVLEAAVAVLGVSREDQALGAATDADTTPATAAQGGGE